MLKRLGEAEICATCSLLQNLRLSDGFYPGISSEYYKKFQLPNAHVLVNGLWDGETVSSPWGYRKLNYLPQG
jgi:hypothetical protein